MNAVDEIANGKPDHDSFSCLCIPVIPYTSLIFQSPLADQLLPALRSKLFSFTRLLGGARHYTTCQGPTLNTQISRLEHSIGNPTPRPLAQIYHLPLCMLYITTKLIGQFPPRNKISYCYLSPSSPLNRSNCHAVVSTQSIV